MSKLGLSGLTLALALGLPLLAPADATARGTGLHAGRWIQDLPAGHGRHRYYPPRGDIEGRGQALLRGRDRGPGTTTVRRCFRTTTERGQTVTVCP